MKTDLFFNRLGFNPDLTTRQSRVDSVSIASRYRVLATLLLCLTLFVGSGNVWGTEGDELYNSGAFNTGSNVSYTMNGTLTKSSKTWTMSSYQINGSVFYLGCNSNHATKGVLAGTNASNPNNAGAWNDVIAALKSASSYYNGSYASAHAYAMSMTATYNTVGKITISWDGAAGPGEAYLFADTGSGLVKLKSQSVSNGASTAGSLEYSNTDPGGINITRVVFVYRGGSDSASPATGTTNKTIRITTVVIKEGKASAPACVAPTSVTITGTNKYLGGQTISLTATPTGGTGTPSYQWQKKISGVWTDLSNENGVSGATSNNLQISSCGYGNSGGYRCIVSTGEGCETKSHTDDKDGYGVHVFSIHGKYTSDANYSDNEIAWTSGTTGTATIHMDAKKTYLFKVWSNNGYYYGHGVNANEDFMFQPTTWDCGVGNREMRLFTTVEGDYTFTVNIEHGLDGSPYVNLQVGYPSMTHPNTGYVYVQKFDWRPYLHYWYNNDNLLSAWGSDPQLKADQYTNICGTDYWCVPVIDYYCNFIAKDAAGDPSYTTGDQHTNSPHPRQRLYNDGSWKWGSFTTYTISYAGGGGNGSMSSHTNLCPGSSQALTANTFSRTHYTFDGWSDGNGHTYANQATITDIQNDINLTAQWAANSYTVSTTLTNVTPNSAFPASVTYTGTTTTALNRTLTVNTTNFSLPTSITVSMAGTGTLTPGTHYTYNNSTGAFEFNVAVTGNITITATAVAKLMSIAITTQPTKRTYFAGETFSSTGAVVTATWGDASTTNVTGSATWTPAGALSAGTSQTVTATYSGKTATTTIDVYSVTVNKVDEGGTAIAAGVTATWTVGSKALTASAGSTNYVFKNWEFSGSNNGLTISNTNSASTTVTGTPTGNVTINAVFYNPVTITWSNNGVTSTTTTAYNTKPTFPSTPESCHPTSTTFIGWASSPWDGTLDDVSDKTIHTTNSSMSAATSATTYYAVFAKAVAGGGGNAHYAKVTSTGDISNDGRYLIVYEASSTSAIIFKGSLETLDASPDTIMATISDGKIAAKQHVIDNEFTIDMTNLYIKSASNKYINYNSGTYGNGLSSLTTTTSAALHSISIDGDGYFVVFGTCNDGSNYVKLKYNILAAGNPNNGSRFRFYKHNTDANNTKDIHLYKYDPGVSYSKYLTTCCENIMALTAGATDATTHCTSLTFSNNNLPTCSDEPTDRQVTITVTPYDGYAAPAELTYSGDGTATYVSGPTGSGPYTYVYEFDKDDDGDGTFTATCTPKAISLVLDKNNSDVSGSANGSATVYFDATSLSTISHATRSGYVLDGYYAEPGCTNKVLTDAGALVNCTGYVVSGKWARATTPTTLYAKWIAKSFEDYKFSCAELTLEPHLVTDGTPIFITSTASKKVRSQDSIHIEGSGLSASQPLTFPDLPSVFEVKTGAYGDIVTESDGTIDTYAYIFYTPAAGSTTDGLDKITGITVSVGGTKPITKTLTKDIIGRHIATDFVIAAKNTNNNKWYALPANMSSECTPAPVEIAVDDIDNPSIAYTANTNIYNLYGQSSGAGYLEEAGQYVKLGMKNNSNYPLFGYTGSKTTIKGDADAIVTNNIGNGYWWLLTQTNTSIANPQDAKYTIGSGNNAKTLSAWFNATPQKWGLFAAGNGEHTLRLIPASSVVPTEAEIVAWGLHNAIVEVDKANAGGTGIAAAKVKAKLNGATSSLITLAETKTSVKNSATKYDYTVAFGDGIDFAANAGQMLTLEWYNSSDVMIAVSNIMVPTIVASNITINKANYSLKSVWNTEVHVLPNVTATVDASAYDNSDVTIKELNIYPGATVNVTTGTLKATTLVMRNGWDRLSATKKYDVARLYITPSTGSLTATNAYSDWYIDYDQYYPIAVPFPVATSSISYKNTSSTATAGVRVRYYDGDKRAKNVQQNQDENWVEYTWGGTMPTNLEPSKGYVMTAKRPTGKAFAIVRMPLTIASSDWTTGGEKGEVNGTHKDQVSVTEHKTSTTPEYAKGWNLIANPYMSLHQGELSLSYTEGSTTVEYANIPDINFKEYDQLPIATTKLKPSSAFLIQAPKTGTVTFSTDNRKASAPSSYRNADAITSIPTQRAYILLGDEQAEDMMGILVSENYTAEYETNADLEKLLSDGNTLRTYMRYADMNIAYLAINEELAKEWIPVSVRIPADGEYTFKMHEASVVGELEGVYLIDYANGDKVTNLLYENYTFTAEAGTDNSRFAINAVVGVHKTPTGLDISGCDKDGPTKFIYHDKVYILHNNVIYDSTGKRVNVINK